MKRMMIIAVMIGAMLMPAQVSAQSVREKRGDKRVQVDVKRGDNKNFGKNDKGFGKNDKRGGFDNKNAFAGKGGNKFNKHGHSPKPKVVHHKPKVVVEHCHHNHKPRPKVVHHHNCNSDVVGAAAAVIGTVALISLLAD